MNDVSFSLFIKLLLFRSIWRNCFPKTSHKAALLVLGIKIDNGGGGQNTSVVSQTGCPCSVSLRGSPDEKLTYSSPSGASELGPTTRQGRPRDSDLVTTATSNHETSSEDELVREVDSVAQMVTSRGFLC
ncbi:hypothetical protein TNIN_405251 [Trichonephila inaurata madagascariensis]|uniref:Uncharacterized protein n=1 Tax=Trichonephila inaurata madagascariensis TaxID=2747483 RepID=A0A8X6XKA5_9ARAC|nr:hypothetical protein TNIN_405251 [Trichonephila inaurata madagascariensis]